MSIFVLDSDPRQSAIYHADSHVVKMLLESVQILCTVRHLWGNAKPHFYKPTHTKHPCVKWVETEPGAYSWLWDLASALAEEYSFRFHGRKHKSAALLPDLKMPKSCYPWRFVQALPQEFMNQKSAISAYRRYYNEGKRHLHKWTRREVPYFIGRID